MAGYTIGLMNMFGNALQEAGYRESDIQKMTKKDFLQRLLPILRGVYDLGYTHFIDCASEPRAPEDTMLIDHIPILQPVEWDPSRIVLHVADSQKKKGGVVGHALREELVESEYTLLNAGMFLWLMKHKELIPESWKEYDLILFFGSLFEAHPEAEGKFVMAIDICDDLVGDCWAVMDGKYNRKCACAILLPS